MGWDRRLVPSLEPTLRCPRPRLVPSLGPTLQCPRLWFEVPTRVFCLSQFSVNSRTLLALFQPPAQRTLQERKPPDTTMVLTSHTPHPHHTETGPSLPVLSWDLIPRFPFYKTSSFGRSRLRESPGPLSPSRQGVPPSPVKLGQGSSRYVRPPPYSPHLLVLTPVAHDFDSRRTTGGRREGVVPGQSVD